MHHGHRGVCFDRPDDPAAAALHVQRRSATPAVLHVGRADSASSSRLVARFLLYNAVVPCWRTFAQRTHGHVASALGATRMSCRRGVAAQRCPQNSDEGCLQMKILSTILANCVCNKPTVVFIFTQRKTFAQMRNRVRIPSTLESRCGYLSMGSPYVVSRQT